jgi:hypothetical protein
VDGKQAEKLWLDEQQLVEDNPSTTKLHPCLGQTLTDSISGYKGIAVARTEYLYSCPRIALQSKGLKDGKPIEQIDVLVDLGIWHRVSLARCRAKWLLDKDCT